jgi:hypothetical protein
MVPSQVGIGTLPKQVAWWSQGQFPHTICMIYVAKNNTKPLCKGQHFFSFFMAISFDMTDLCLILCVGNNPEKH